MRLLLKRGTAYNRVFKLDLRKNKKGVSHLVGTLALFDYLKEYLPNAAEVDMHFSYFSSGNYHFSYKYYNTVEELYVDRKIYHNHVVVYKGDSRKQEDMQVVEGPRDRLDGEVLDSFMMGEPLKEWTVRPLGHTFSSMGSTLTESNIKSLLWVADANRDDDEDLIIEVDDYINAQVSFGCSIYSLGNPTHDFDVTPLPLPVISKTKVFGDLVINVYMVIVKAGDPLPQSR